MAVNKTSLILVVDDNPVNTDLYERVIKQIAMCFPKCFTKASEALAWAKSTAPTVALVDYRMSEMDGFEFIRQLRSIPGRHAVPCIMLTGVKDDGVRDQALKLGVVEFLNKPVSAERLMAILRKLTQHG